MPQQTVPQYENSFVNGILLNLWRTEIQNKVNNVDIKLKQNRPLINK